MAAPDVAWNPESLPSLEGRTYLVTGATAGVGYFAAEQLAAAGAGVIVSGRNPHRMQGAREALQRRVPEARVETLLLDTSNLGSVRAAAATVRARRRLDGLLLNAGIVHPPSERSTTPEGHEVVFATNVLGHFALAGELLDVLAGTGRAHGDAHLVWLGSLSTFLGRYDPVDPELRADYSPWRAYVQSKVATTALGIEADRRLRAAGLPVRSIVAHPGYAISGRTPGIRIVNEPNRRSRFVDNLQTPIAQSKQAGAWAPVRALVDPGVQGGEYWGPRAATKGAPRRGRPSRQTTDPELGERLWSVCEDATAVHWPF